MKSHSSPRFCDDFVQTPFVQVIDTLNPVRPEKREKVLFEFLKEWLWPQRREFLCVWVFCVHKEVYRVIERDALIRPASSRLARDVYPTIQLGLYSPTMTGETTATPPQWPSLQPPLWQDLPFCIGGKDPVFAIHSQNQKVFIHCSSVCFYGVK